MRKYILIVALVFLLLAILSDAGVGDVTTQAPSTPEKKRKQPGEKTYNLKQQKYFEKKGERFLDEIAKRNDVIFLNGGLMVQMLKKAEESARSPNAMDQVEVIYTGYMPDGTVFDGSTERPGGKMTVRPKHVIECWTAALQMMGEGDHWRVYCPWNLAYGAEGSHPMKVPPYMALYYDIEMLKVLSNQSSKHDDDEDEGVKVLPGKTFQEARKLFHEFKAPDQTPLAPDFKRSYSDDKKSASASATASTSASANGEL